MASPSFFGTIPSQTTDDGVACTMPTMMLPAAFREQVPSQASRAEDGVLERVEAVGAVEADVRVAYRRLAALVAETSLLLESFHRATTATHASLAQQTRDAVSHVASTADRLNDARDALVAGVRDEMKHGLTALVPLMTTLVVQLEKWNDGMRLLDTTRSNNEILTVAVSALHAAIRDQEENARRRTEDQAEQHEEVVRTLMRQNQILETVLSRRMCNAETQTPGITVKDSMTEMSPPPVDIIDVEKENKKERVLIEWKDVDVADLNLDHGILERLKKKQKTNAAC